MYGERRSGGYGGGSGGYGGGYGGGRDRDYGGGFQQTTAPVKVGEELDVRIEAVGEKGDGIAKKNGFVLFVPNTKEGENVKIRVTKVLRKVGFAEVIGAAGSGGERQAKSAEPAMDQPPAPEDTENFGEVPEADETLQ